MCKNHQKRSSRSHAIPSRIFCRSVELIFPERIPETRVRRTRPLATGRHFLKHTMLQKDENRKIKIFDSRGSNPRSLAAERSDALTTKPQWFLQNLWLCVYLYVMDLSVQLMPRPCPAHPKAGGGMGPHQGCPGGLGGGHVTHPGHFHWTCPACPRWARTDPKCC